MTTTIQHESLSREQKLAVLAHMYLELRLSSQSAFDAADLDGFVAVAEAA
jgi:hypothetical protein